MPGVLPQPTPCCTECESSEESLASSPQVITGNDTVTFTNDLTILDATSGGPYTVVLPNGGNAGEVKRIVVLGDNIATTAVFNMTGTFAGFTSLSFDSIGFNVDLMWDGDKWQLIGGNANVIL